MGVTELGRVVRLCGAAGVVSGGGIRAGTWARIGACNRARVCTRCGNARARLLQSLLQLPCPGLGASECAQRCIAFEPHIRRMCVVPWRGRCMRVEHDNVHGPAIEPCPKDLGVIELRTRVNTLTRQRSSADAGLGPMNPYL